MAAANTAFLSPAKSVSFAPSLITPDRAIVFCFPAFAFNMLVGSTKNLHCAVSSGLIVSCSLWFSRQNTYTSDWRAQSEAYVLVSLSQP